MRHARATCLLLPGPRESSDCTRSFRSRTVFVGRLPGIRIFTRGCRHFMAERASRTSPEEHILDVFDEAARIQTATGRTSAKAIADAAAVMCAALSKEGKVIVFGNGGSAADSQHFAAELVGRFQHNRRPLSAVSLTTDTSIITAVGNDYAFD